MRTLAPLGCMQRTVKLRTLKLSSRFSSPLDSSSLHKGLQRALPERVPSLGATPSTSQVALIVLLALSYAAAEIVHICNGLQEVCLYQTNVVELRGGGSPGTAASLS